MKIFILFLILSVFSVHAEVNYDEYIKEVQNFHQKKHPKNAEKFALLVSEMNESEFSEDWKNLVVTAVTRFEHVQNFISYYSELSESEKKDLLDNREVTSESFKKAFEAFNKLNPEQKNYLATYYLPDNKRIEVKDRIAVLGRLNQYYFRLRNSNNYLKGFDATNLKYEPNFRLLEKFDVSNNNNIVKLLGLSDHSFFIKLSTVHDSVVAAFSERDKYWRPLVKYAPREALKIIKESGVYRDDVYASIEEQKLRNKKIETLLSSGSAKEKEEAVSMLEDAYLSLDSILGKNHKVTLEAKIDLFTAKLQLNKLSSGDLSKLTNELVNSEDISDVYLFGLISKFVTGLNEIKKFEESFELLNANFEPAFLSSKRAASTKINFDIKLHDLHREIVHEMFNADEYPSQTYKNKSYTIAEKRLELLKKNKGDSSEVYKRWAFVYAAICSSVYSCKKEIISDTYNRHFKSKLEESPLKTSDINLMRKFSAEVYSFRGLNKCFICNFPSPGKHITAVDMYLDVILKAHENKLYDADEMRAVINVLERDYSTSLWPLENAMSTYQLVLKIYAKDSDLSFREKLIRRLIVMNQDLAYTNPHKEMNSTLISKHRKHSDLAVDYAKMLYQSKIIDDENVNVDTEENSRTIILFRALIESTSRDKNNKPDLNSKNLKEGIDLAYKAISSNKENFGARSVQYYETLIALDSSFYNINYNGEYSVSKLIADSFDLEVIKKDEIPKILNKSDVEKLITLRKLAHKSDKYSRKELENIFDVFFNVIQSNFNEIRKLDLPKSQMHLLNARYACALQIFTDYKDSSQERRKFIEELIEESEKFFEEERDFTNLFEVQKLSNLRLHLSIEQNLIKIARNVSTK